MKRNPTHAHWGVLFVLLLLSAVGCSSDRRPDDAGRVGTVVPMQGAEQDEPPLLRTSPAPWAQSNASEGYWFVRASSGATARSFRQGLLASLSAGELQVRPDQERATWTTRMSWRAVGRGERLDTVQQPSGAPQLRGSRASYHRADGSEEWYQNGPSGIEQGFVIKNRPPGSVGMLVLQVKVEGSLSPWLSVDREQVLLRDAQDLPVLRYAHLVALDAQGTNLTSHMQVHDGSIWLHVDDQGARYPVTIDPLVWRENRKLLASDAQTGDRFGAGASFSGDAVIVGAYRQDEGASNAGAAYIFYRNQGGNDNWGQVAKLRASDAQADDEFGYSVSIDGNVAIVGAHYEDEKGDKAGAAYVFYRDAGGSDSWAQVAKLRASDAQEGDQFGNAVAISEEMAIVGAPAEDDGGDNAGAAYVFCRDAGGTDSWAQVARLKASDVQATATFGSSVAISGSTAVVGSPTKKLGLNNVGAAYVFQRDLGGADQWGQAAKLASGSSGAISFGGAVDIHEDVTIIGAWGDDEGGINSGAAFVFYRNQGGDNKWGRVVKLKASDGLANDTFGNKVAIRGDTAVVGAPSVGLYTGAVYLFQRNEGGTDLWGEVARIMAHDAQPEARFGNATAIGADRAIVGASLQDGTGAAYVLALAQTEGDDCTGGAECHSGYCVDGVCCDDECGRVCMACSNSLTGASDGQCAFVRSGQDPDGDCVAGASSCDGHGACKLLLGQPCDSSSPCMTNLCVDGVCCDSPCDGLCEACTSALAGGGQDGRCQPIAQGTDPDQECDPDPSNVCGADGMCNGSGACREVASQGTPCGQPSCSNSVQLLPALCDNNGVCAAPVTRECFPFGCNSPGEACLTSCQTSDDCATGTWCNNTGVCVAGGTCRDSASVTLSTGEIVDCTPFTCDQDLGACKERCDSTVDCVGGYICTSGQQCVPFSEPDRAADTGCACSTPRGGTSGDGWLLLCLAPLTVAHLRRRRRTLCDGPGNGVCRSGAGRRAPRSA